MHITTLEQTSILPTEVIDIIELFMSSDLSTVVLFLFDSGNLQT